MCVLHILSPFSTVLPFKESLRFSLTYFPLQILKNPKTANKFNEIYVKISVGSTVSFLSFSMTQSNFATNPEHGEIYSLLTESQSDHQLSIIPGFYYIVR